MQNNTDAKGKKRIKKGKILLIGIFATVLLVVSITTGMFFNELRSLSSLEKVDDYGMFRMTYYGDYGFDDFLKVGAESDADIENFITKRLLKGLPIDLGITGNGCTAFVSQNENGEIIMGRNFDFTYAPSLQVFTCPKNGYASVSTVNLSFAGYSEESLPEGSIRNKFLALSAPYLTFDGMNEKGVAIALLSVPEAAPPNDSSRITLNTTTSIRLVLDKAASVDEAVDLLSQYNIYFSADVYCHYLIADATGRSVLVEYYDNALQVIEVDTDYQIASNFVAYNGVNIGEGFTEFERYDAVEAALNGNGNRISEAEAANLLARIGVRDGDTDKLQWSVIYNLTTLTGNIFAHRNKDNILGFDITNNDARREDKHYD